MSSSMITGRNNRDQNAQQTKILRMKMRKFNGKNVEGWIYKGKCYIHYHLVPDEERLVQETMNMEDEALD